MRLTVGQDDTQNYKKAPEKQLFFRGQFYFATEGQPNFALGGQLRLPSGVKRARLFQSWMLKENVGYYQNQVVRIDDVDFILSTLWSHIPPEDEFAVSHGLNDFYQTEYDGHRLMVADYNEMHRFCLDFIPKSVSESTAKKIVVTHHLPTLQVVAPQHKGSPINSAFVTELGDFIAGSRIDCWIYGHSHTNIDTQIGGTKIVSNQLGYVFQQEHLHNWFSHVRMIDV